MKPAKPMIPGPSKVKNPARMIPGPSTPDERLVVRPTGTVSTKKGVVVEPSFGRPRGDYSARMVPGPCVPNGTPAGTERTQQAEAIVESLIAQGHNRPRAMQMALAQIGNGAGNISKAPEVVAVKRGDDIYGPFRHSFS